MGLPKASDWKKHDKILNAGLKGFNALTEIPKAIKAEMPDFKRFKFGFFSGNDVPEMHSMGWVHLESHMFDVEEWNKAVGLRFGLTNTEGLVKYRENYIMIMDMTYRKRLENVRIDESERELATSLEGVSSYAHPSDSRYGEMKAASKDLGGVELTRVQAEGQAPSGAEPKKRGRPPGSKNKE